MNNQSESQRIAMLKSVRNENNYTIIDQAIKDGMTFEELVRSMANNRGLGAKAIVEAMSLQKLGSVSDNAKNDLKAFQEAEQFDLIVAGINAKRGGQALPMNHSVQSSSEEAECIDLIAASANLGRQPLNKDQSRVASAVPAEQSIEDIIATSANQNRQNHRRN